MLSGTGLLLLTAVAGYWVLERAETHKGQLKRVGQFVGWLVIVASIVSLLCRAWCVASWKGGSCPFMMRPKHWGGPSSRPMMPPPDSMPSESER